MYDYDYFERGLETGKSCYQNYRWIPELTIPMAMTIIDYLGVANWHKVLDFGCAKGYLVKALRWLNREAWGIDKSIYALNNCDPEVSSFCWSKEDLEYFGPDKFDFCIAKDVFEHVELSDLSTFLKSGIADVYFAVIPLGNNGEFVAPANNLDITHVNCMTEKDWLQFFKDNGLKCEAFTFKIDGIKDSYYEQYPTGHGFFTLHG